MEECPKAFFTSSKQINISFGTFSYVNPRFSSLQQFNIEILSDGEKVQSCSNVSIKDIANLTFPSTVELTSVSTK